MPNMDPLSAWHVHTLRITAFPLQPERSLGEGWWEQFANMTADSDERQPTLGTRTISGGWLGGRLALKLQPDRIEWNLGSIVDLSQPRLPAVGTFTQISEPFYFLARSWLTVCPPIWRLAVGGVFLQEAPDHERAYAKLAQLLPAINIDPTGSCDFNYSINRPRNIEGVTSTLLKINRLTRWSALKMATSYSVPDRPGTTVTAFSTYAARLETDVNTDGDFPGELPAYTREKLLDTLLAYQQELLATGDIP